MAVTTRRNSVRNIIVQTEYRHDMALWQTTKSAAASPSCGVNSSVVTSSDDETKQNSQKTSENISANIVFFKHIELHSAVTIKEK